MAAGAALVSHRAILQVEQFAPTGAGEGVMSIWVLIIGVIVAASVYAWAVMMLDMLRRVLLELQELNGVFRCSRFLAIPSTLDAIQHNTAKPKTPAKKKPRR